MQTHYVQLSAKEAIHENGNSEYLIPVGILMLSSFVEINTEIYSKYLNIFIKVLSRIKRMLGLSRGFCFL